MSRPRTLHDIEADLRALVSRWGNYAGTEKSGAQTFLNELIAAYTGTASVFEMGARFEEFGARDEGAGYMDLYWPGVAIVEMKAPKESRRLDTHRAQALDYWRNSADPETNTPAPPYLVLCSFRSFEVWEPGKFPNAPRDTFTLDELPSRAEALLFLAGGAPIYGGPGEKVTREAAGHMVDLYFRLLDRGTAPPDELRRFIIQSVWVLFAEDVGLIPSRIYEALLRALVADPTRSPGVEISDLLRRLNVEDDERRNRGRPTKVPYVNGALFADTPEVPLDPEELQHLLAAAAYDWRWVNPTVFGSLMEGCLGHDHRWELGAHYTNQEDILSIVRPVIVRPWTERIEATTDINEALNLLNELVKFRVLDPAMGCGNFLAIAYRELRGLEGLLVAHIKDLHEAAGLLPPITPKYPVRNIFGIEIDPFAVEIAKATLWMTHALVAREFGAPEAPLPLPALDHLMQGDSLKRDWPVVEAIIGNPPFHGDKRLRSVVGDEYIDWLKDTFGIGVQDHCVYFFRKAHEHLREGQRAGLVATNTIAQTGTREAGLAWIVDNGGRIVEAVSTKPWSGDAKVHVSIVCWEKGGGTGPTFLDGVEVDGISPALREGSVHRVPHKLAGHDSVVFIGYMVGGAGFVLSSDEAQALLARGDADYSDVVVPLINGEDIVRRVHSDPSRWVIDFSARSLEDAAKYPAALDIVRREVQPVRAKDRRRSYREAWWQFSEKRPKLRSLLPGVTRVVIAPMTGKRWLPVWGDPRWRASNTTLVFIFDDDFSIGILLSAAHALWVRTHASTLKGDLRYGTASCFETFPWPTEATEDVISRVAAASRAVITERAAATTHLGKGLTAVYNAMDDGAFTQLRQAHRGLDEAVLAAYGLPAVLLDDEAALLDAFFDLNEEAAKNPSYEPFPTGNGRSPTLLG